MYSKQSLETLRQRIDLIDALSPYVEFKRAGAVYKALCPFHDEKTASFTVQKGDNHYHCFGCGAHGDAIQFLVNHQKFSFVEAIESLAQRFQVHLDEVDEKEKGPDKGVIKRALALAGHFYNFMLLHTPEGHQALKYLYSRGIDLAFIRHFQIGWAPRSQGIFRKVIQSQGIQDQTLIEAGLLSLSGEGTKREFFNDRITIPIHNSSGAIIGFTARKIRDETFGGKYINTSETILFKKSRVLFGLNHSRRRIAKERRAIIVEGQLDALRLIYAGFNFTVAGQGTAFGEGHVQELLLLGVQQVFLALDPDDAGVEAAIKIGNAFQKEGVEVYVVLLPMHKDPDTFLREAGPQAFQCLLRESCDYLTFVIRKRTKEVNMSSPAHKNALVLSLSKQIREWNNQVMVHESLRKLAFLMGIPENLVGVGQELLPHALYIKSTDHIVMEQVNGDKILETDLLRWLLLSGDNQKRYYSIITNNLSENDFHYPLCRTLFHEVSKVLHQGMLIDLMSLVTTINDEGRQLLVELSDKRINKEKGEKCLIETIQAILTRNWMRLKENIRQKMSVSHHSEEEASLLTKQYSELNQTPPTIKY